MKYITVIVFSLLLATNVYAEPEPVTKCEWLGGHSLSCDSTVKLSLEKIMKCLEIDGVEKAIITSRYGAEIIKASMAKFDKDKIKAAVEQILSSEDQCGDVEDFVQRYKESNNGDPKARLLMELLGR